MSQVLDVGTRVVGAAALQRTLHSSSVCFDASVDELWLPLAFGGCVVVCNDLLDLCEDPSSMPKQLHDLTMLNGTPSAMQVPACLRLSTVNTTCAHTSRHVACAFFS